MFALLIREPKKCTWVKIENNESVKLTNSEYGRLSFFRDLVSN